LAQRVAAGEPLKLSLRPSDPLAHPLVSGGQSARAGLLLSVAASGGASVRLVVDAAHSFEGLADAQYLSAPPPKRSRLAADGDELAAAVDSVEEAGEAAPLLTVPPLFFHSDAPVDYAFRELEGAAAGEASAAAAAAAAGGGGRARAAPPPGAPGGPPVVQDVDFRAAGVPAPLPAGSEWASPPDVAAVLTPLFEERAAWSFAALQARLPKAVVVKARKYLPSHAFRFLNGPWHRLWVRRGLDPRLDSAAKRFQSLDFRLPAEWYPATRGGGEGDKAPGPKPAADRGDFAAVHALRALPARRSTFFQLCDLRHPLIASLVGSAAELGACDEHTGWYKRASLDSIKALLRESFELVARGEGFDVVPPKPRKNAKHGKAARVAATLAIVRERLAAGCVDGGEEEQAEEEEEEEEEEEAEEAGAQQEQPQLLPPEDAPLLGGDGDEYDLPELF